MAGCREAGLLGDPSGAMLRLNPRGRLAAETGIEPETARRLLALTQHEPDPADGAGAGDLGRRCRRSGLWRWPPADFWPVGRSGRGAAEMARRWFAERGQEVPKPLAAVLAAPSPADGAALEAGWRLAHWIGPEATPEVEARTGWPAGAFAARGRGACLAGVGAGGFGRAASWPRSGRWPGGGWGRGWRAARRPTGPVWRCWG